MKKYIRSTYELGSYARPKKKYINFYLDYNTDPEDGGLWWDVYEIDSDSIVKSFRDRYSAESWADIADANYAEPDWADIADATYNKPDVMSSTVMSDDSDDEVAWDPYNGFKYKVVCGYDSSNTNNPKAAIRRWFKGQSKNPMDCAILAKYKSDAIDLASIVTMDLLEEMNAEYPQGYKLDWLYDVAQRFVQRNGSDFLGDGDLGDQVPPFTYG